MTHDVRSAAAPADRPADRPAAHPADRSADLRAEARGDRSAAPQRRHSLTDPVVRAALALVAVAAGMHLMSDDLVISRSVVFGAVVACGGLLLVVSTILQVMERRRSS